MSWAKIIDGRGGVKISQCDLLKKLYRLITCLQTEEPRKSEEWTSKIASELGTLMAGLLLKLKT